MVPTLGLTCEPGAHEYVCRLRPLIESGVDRNEVRPLFRSFIERKDRLDWARRDACTAIDAFVGVNIQHFRRLKLGFVLSRMDAVHGAHIDTRAVLRAHTWFADDIRHAVVLQGRPREMPSAIDRV